MAPNTDLTTRRFTRWIVLERTAERTTEGKVKYLCRCDCGTERLVPAPKLTKGKSKSCGCLQRKAPGEHNNQLTRRIARAENFVGQRFDSLTVTAVHSFPPALVRLSCTCDCGRTYLLTHKTLTSAGFYCSCSTGKQSAQRIAHKLTMYRSAAASRGYAWGLSDDEAVELFHGACGYCGDEPGIKLNGIDRKDNALGYTLDNVVSCCWVCNRAKMDLPLSEFLAWIERLRTRRLDK